jgi:hypothetical protein
MGLCCEVFCPVILVLIGCGLTKIQFLHDTPATIIQPDAYPYQQRMLMNDVAMVDTDVSGAVTPQTLATNLPNATYFDVTFDAIKDDSLTEFYDQVTDQ